MFKKFGEFVAGILFGAFLAKSSLIFGMAAERAKTKMRDEDAKSKTEKES